ncbi:Crp/Fnr family transcriptional regulator [Elizabethkingia anophelis]|nr:Crp/Fnr family transcriptional regulator [Elizabethkingia anophelis]
MLPFLSVSIFHAFFYKFVKKMMLLVSIKNENDSYKEIIEYFGKFFLLNNEDINDIKKYFIYKRIQKNVLIEQKGKITNNLYFIASGFIHVYVEKMIDGIDEIITTQINCPTRLITTFESFNSGNPSEEYLKTITEVGLLIISKDNFLKLLNKDDRWRDAFKQIYEQGLSYNEQRSKDMLTLDAEKRYLKLMDTRPELINNVPVKILASFIGIKSQSLSRIRGKIK